MDVAGTQSSNKVHAVSFIFDGRFVVAVAGKAATSVLSLNLAVTYTDSRTHNFLLASDQDIDAQSAATEIGADFNALYSLNLSSIEEHGIPAGVDVSSPESELLFNNPRYHLIALSCDSVESAKEMLWFSSSPRRQNSDQSTCYIAEQSFLNTQAPLPVRANALVIYCYKLGEAEQRSPHDLTQLVDELLEQIQTLEFNSASKLDKDCLTGSVITAYWHYLLSIGEQKSALEVASRVLSYSWQTPYHHFGLNVSVSLLLLSLHAHKKKQAQQLVRYFDVMKQIFDRLAGKSITNPEWFQDLGGIHRATLAVWRLKDDLETSRRYSEWFVKDAIRKSVRIRNDAFFKRIRAVYGKPI